MTPLATAPLPCCDPLADFIRSTASVIDADAETIDQLCSRIGIARDRARWQSTLNNDGAPIQIRLGLRRGMSRPDGRLIADPHEGATDAPSRMARSRRALAQLADWHAPDLADLCGCVLARMTPSGCGIPYLRDGGDAWVAAGTDGRGVAVYATARWGDAASRWLRAFGWLVEVCPAAARTISTLAGLAAHTSLVSVGVEGSTADNARAKFYWRPNGSAPLSDLGVPLLAHEALAAFLADATQGMATPVTAIVGSVGVRLATGSLADVKLDLCGHCVPRSRTDWARRIDRYANRHGLPAPMLTRLKPDAPIEIAFVGMGIDHDFEPRLNIYLKPAIPEGQR